MKEGKEEKIEKQEKSETMQKELNKESKEKQPADYFLLGIDDAGRGPVIGPMVLAGCLLTPEVEQELKKLGVTDSKLLTRRKREKFSELIKKKSIAHFAHAISPVEIDTGMGIGLNLNEVEALATGVIINNLINNIKDKSKNIKIIIDCPSTNIPAWRNSLAKYIKHNKENLEIQCDHKADLRFPVVSAASILAKVLRDFEIEKLKKKIGIDFGSGYPADPKTKKFLEKYINHEGMKKERIFRETWSTWRRAKNKKNQTELPDY